MDFNSENDSFQGNNTIFFSPSTYGSYSLIAATAVSLIVSTTCLFFTMFQLKTLKKSIKICLIIMACQLILNSSICLFANITMKISSTKSMLTCLLVTQPPIVSIRSTWTMIAAISMLRYVMAWKASKERFTVHAS